MITFRNKRLQDVATPTLSSDAANKAYVDALVQGLDIKPSARALASTAVGTLSGLATTIDGVLFSVDGMRALLTAESSQVNNGPWLVHAGAWTRPPDFAAGSSAAGAFTFIEQGTVWSDSGWVCTANTGSDIVGTDNLPWVQFSAAGVISVDATLAKTGNVIGMPTVATPATVGDASHVPATTVDPQGRVTGLTSVAISVNASAVSSGNLANARLPVTTTGAVLFGRGGGGYDSDSSIAVDPVNHRLGVHQSTPTHTLDVGGDAATTGNVSVGNQLTVSDTSTLTGHVDANDGLAVNNAILTANATGTAFAVTAGNADLQHDAHVGGDMTVDGHIFGIVPWSLPLVTVQSPAGLGALATMFLAPSSADRQQTDRRFRFAGFGRSSLRQSLQAVMNFSQISPGGGTAGFSVTWEVFVNGSSTGLAITAPLTPVPGLVTPTSYGATATLTIPDGAQVSVRETGATTAGSPSSVEWNAYIMLVLL
jgi:hypothetical protein